MNLKIVSWNVRGIHDAGKRSSISNLLKSWNLDVVCLQETKMKSIPMGTIRSIWPGHFPVWVVLPASGTSGDSLDVGQTCCGMHR
jgi:exonuclease III